MYFVCYSISGTDELIKNNSVFMLFYKAENEI